MDLFSGLMFSWFFFFVRAKPNYTTLSLSDCDFFFLSFFKVLESSVEQKYICIGEADLLLCTH